ncbi:MAG TPA: hypothetical protein VGB18_06850 [Candidatus Thermoplasmatota archaeon]
MRTQWTFPMALFVLLVLPSAAAQFPALAPVIETRVEWTEFQPEPLTRTVKLDETGTWSVPAQVGFRILAPGGYIACAPGTMYGFTVDTESIPAWLQASLQPEEAKSVSVTVPQGTHQNGWPELGAWHWQPIAALRLDWQLASVPENASAEVKVVGKGAVIATAGGCQPDPLAQPVRHIPETLNVTRPFVPPPPATTAASSGCDLGTATSCQTIVPVNVEKTDGANLGLVLLAAAVSVAMGRRRR